MRKVSTTLIAISMLFAISLFIIGCDDDDNGTQPTPSPTVSPTPTPTLTPTPTPSVLGSDISQACAGQFAGFIGAIRRGSFCLCEGEFRGEFVLNLGPAPDPEYPLNIGMGEAASIFGGEGRRTVFGVEEKDASTFSLFNVERNPDVPGGFTFVGDPVGELQNLIEGVSSLEFVIQLGDDPPERVVCPACAVTVNPETCDVEEELDKPKCLDTQTLEATGSSCPANSIVRVCDPFTCGGEVVEEEAGQSTAFDGPLPSENSVAQGCNTIEGSFTYTNIEDIPPSGTLLWTGRGEGTFSCQLSPSPAPTPQCLTQEELANTDCPAQALPQSCDSFFCGACFETEEGTLCADFFFTPSELPSDCQVVDCNTLDCGKGGTFNNLQVNGGSPSWTENIEGQEVLFGCGVITASPTPTP